MHTDRHKNRHFKNIMPKATGISCVEVIKIDLTGNVGGYLQRHGSN